MSEVSIVFVTAGSEDDAARIGRTLVDEKLAACANIVPAIRSIYHWKGETYDEHESLIIIKTQTALFPLVEKRVKEIHSYEVPEIIALPLQDGLPAYMGWIAGSTRQQQ